MCEETVCTRCVKLAVKMTRYKALYESLRPDAYSNISHPAYYWQREAQGERELALRWHRDNCALNKRIYDLEQRIAQLESENEELAEAIARQEEVA